ncbi:uncharacterized protein TRIVIDRAFT_209435 [Trichoderma virens Gv29-8]|uniref:Uncharacterized protein n=1 Tax=Hypocrea virens (strain Gv29-8 / FGSC 10586) TaxID=413071 RepID=G9MVU2_HYPVG|nr:uncharacterized protein TRIVIDRAFT_209435 [Trichoderma virens Gv29-8]EHK21417.1 hypothetical protein TRIVIDRAFT_209435 [Trichoderma virens Gv29-8]UKZ53371.1 hypothetical protein TrVGV298_007163 [Trichoderma virens]
MASENSEDLAVRDNSFPIDYSFTIEFMVAQELPDFDYSSGTEEPQDSRFENLWVCPAEEQDPCTAILGRCRDLLTNENEAVAVCEDPSAPDTTVTYFSREDGPPMGLGGHWFIEPSPTTYSRRHSPRMYEWYGVRLRSPTYRELDLMNRMRPVKWILGLLREALVIHVNSTCRFNVHVKPALTPISLLTAKKLTTLVWVLEKELLERVCPNSYGLPYPHVKTLETCSRIASMVWYGSGGRVRQQDPLRAAISKQHLPQLRDMDLLTRLELVWDANSTEELAKGLLGTNGAATSFAIPPAGKYSHGPTFEFRYSLWHPYDQLDVSAYWIELSIRLLRATARNGDKFKQYISQLDDLIHGFSVNSTPAADRWKALSSTLGLTEEWSAPLETIVEHYKNGQRLAYRWIDRQEFLISRDGGH